MEESSDDLGERVRDALADSGSSFSDTNEEEGAEPEPARSQENPGDTVDESWEGSSDEPYRMAIYQDSSQPPSGEVKRLQSQMRELAESMIQLKGFVEEGFKTQKERNDLRPYIPPARRPESSASSKTSELSQGESADLPRPPRTAPVREQQGTRVETRPETVCTDDIWAQSMQRIIASIEKPKLALPTFTGESRKEYGLFTRRFHRYLRDHSVEAGSKLDMLIDACTGPMKDLLMGYVRLGPEEGYTEALKMLASRLGDTHDHIDEALVDLVTGTEIEDNDLRQIKEFTDKIWDIISDLEFTDRKADVETYLSVALLARRLTGQLRQRYKNHLHKYKKKTGPKARPGLKWFRDFMEDYIERLTVDIEDSDSRTRKELGHGAKGKRPLSVPKKKAMGFSALTANVSSRQGQGESSKDVGSCTLCGRPHPLHACWKFRDMTVAERWEAAKAAKACYMCLSDKHMVGQCNSPYKKCGLEGCCQQHSRWLHIGEQPRGGARKRPQQGDALETPSKRIKPDKTAD